MINEETKNSLGRRIGDLSELPEDLRQELQISKTDELEDQIIESINLLDRMASIDEILVQLYRKHNVLQKRRFLTSKLYRMAHAGLLYSVKKKKGVYTTQKELVDVFVSS